MNFKAIAMVGMFCLIATAALGGAYVYLFTEPIQDGPEIVYCEHGFDEATQSCIDGASGDCYVEEWYDPNANETVSEEVCVAAMVDAPRPYTTDGGDPVFQVPGTNVVFPIPQWASFMLLGIFVLKTGTGTLSSIKKFFSRGKK